MGEPGVSTVSTRNARVSFEPDPDALKTLVGRGFRRTIATAGIYKPWYFTDLRRYFWSRTLIDGSPASYHGRGGELLLGVLVAISVLVAIQLTLIGVATLTPLSSSVAALVNPVLLPLIYFARYRGRRYRARRTAWRGIRLDQDGSALVYALIATGWWLVILITLGLAFPFMQASLERYRLRHTLIGTRRFESAASGRRLLLPWLVPWAFIVSPLALIIGLVVTANICVVSLDTILKPPRFPIPTIKIASLTPCIFVEIYGARILQSIFTPAFLIASLLIPYYRAREIRVFLNAIRLGDTALTSTLTAKKYYQSFISWLLKLGKITIAIVLVEAVAISLFVFTKDYIDQYVRYVIAGFVVGCLLYYYLWQTSLVFVQVLRAGQWKAVAGSITVLNADALEALVPRTPGADSGLGEGLAVSLDPGGAFDIGL